jgi:hypothetical protein
MAQENVCLKIEFAATMACIVANIMFMDLGTDSLCCSKSAVIFVACFHKRVPMYIPAIFSQFAR